MLRNPATPVSVVDGDALDPSLGDAAGTTDTALMAGGESLVSLLGHQRARLVTHLHDRGAARVTDLAAVLGVSEVATRRHLDQLLDQGLVAADDVADGPGRPARHYRLTDKGLRLFPTRYVAMVRELLDFLEASGGRDRLREYLRWRSQRQATGFESAVDADDVEGRIRQLAAALSDAGYDATVEVAGDRFVLRQAHCAVFDVAKDHPEMCAHEAAAFSRVLGDEVHVSRRQTRANGATACECCVTPRPTHGPPAERSLPIVDHHATPDPTTATFTATSTLTEPHR